MSRILKLMVISALFIVGCKGKQTSSDVDQAPSISNQTTQGPQLENQPLGFDTAGSDSGNISGLKTIYFPYDQSTLDEQAKKDLQGNVAWMKSKPGVRMQIEGHCDNRGTIEYNLALGERRANAVKSYMQSLGVAADMLSTISYGEERPLVQGDSDSAWAKNRRANFVPAQ